jgi:hypothetical protein
LPRLIRPVGMEAPRGVFRSGGSLALA